MKTLEQTRDRLAEEVGKMVDGDGTEYRWYHAEQNFRAGWDAALKALSEQADEHNFMEALAHKWKSFYSDHAIIIEVSRWQFEQMRGRVALAESLAKDCQHEMRMMIETNTYLTARLEQAERERDSYSKGMFTKEKELQAKLAACMTNETRALNRCADYEKRCAELEAQLLEVTQKYNNFHQRF